MPQYSKKNNMDYSELEKVNVFFADAKKIILGILLGFLVVFIFKSCQPQPTPAGQTMSKNEIAKQKEIANDYKFKYEILEIENAKLIQKKDSLKAVAELSKNNYYQLKRTKPKYIETVTNCNDTLQAVYTFVVQKDSLCNVAMQNLDNVIFSQDSVKKVDESQKKLLLNSILIKDNLLNNSEKQNFKLENEVKTQKKNKNLWKTATIGAVVIIGKLVLFK